jgi:Ran GTPase-activating protein (RanGAP) involved in mRNA processing and transport
LYLEGNLLHTQGTIKLAKLMLNHRSLPNLAELSLKACQITDEGMKALAEGLLVKKNIRKLNLRYIPTPLAISP